MIGLITWMAYTTIAIFWFVFIAIVATYATFWLIDKLEEKRRRK